MFRAALLRSTAWRGPAWALLLLALLACAEAADPAQAPDRIVLVTIDTLRADHVGAYGAVPSPTPTLDALAERGVRFAAAVSPTPLTLPSHSSLLTGLEPPRHGVRHNSLFRLGEEIPTLAERLQEGGFATAAFVGAVVLDAGFGLARGFAVYDDALGGGRGSGEVIGYAERTADAVVDAALGWLAEAPARFFLWVHLYDPHYEYRPPPAYALPGRSAYAGEVAFADAELGRLLAGVGERFGSEGTLVVVTSDHGESLEEHGESTHSRFVYEATQRVPLVLAGAGLPAGRVVEAPVGLVDVAPTLLALAEAAPLGATSGRSLLPLLAGEAWAPRAVYVETLATQLDFGWSPLLGLRTAEHKYIRAPEPELYALGPDPGELRNLAAAEPERVARLDARLTERLAAAGAPAPRRELTAAERGQLESLGYVVDPEAPGRVAPGQLGQVGGPDPKHRIRETEQRIAEAQQLLRAGRPAAARDLLGSLEGDGPVFLLLRARAALAAGEPAEAEALARRAIGLESRRWDAFELLGRSVAGQGRLEEAQAALVRAAELAPEQPAPALHLGQLSERLGDLATAERAYRQALAARPLAGEEPASRLAALLARAGRVEQALEVLDSALAGLPRSERLLRQRTALDPRARARRGPPRAADSGPTAAP